MPDSLRALSEAADYAAERWTEIVDTDGLSDRERYRLKSQAKAARRQFEGACADHVRALIVAQPAGQAGDAGADLGAYLARQMAWSQRAFGNRSSAIGLTKHIEKECAEIRTNPHDLVEWVDVVMLALDGYWRHGGTPADVMPTLLGKLAKNEAREWPVNENPDEPNEHDRSDEPAPNSTRTGAAETGDKLVRLLAAVSDRLRDNPPNGLVEGDLYVAAKNEGPASGWRYVPTGLTVGDLDEARALLAARPEAPSDAGWSFDMGAAPRDGTVILLWREGWGEPSAAYWGLAPMAYDAGIADRRHPWVFLDSTNGVNGYEDGGHGPMAWHPMLDAPTPPSDPAPSGQAEG